MYFTRTPATLVTSLKNYKQHLWSHVGLLKWHNMVYFGWKWKSKFNFILNTIQTYYLNKDCLFAVFIILCAVLQLCQNLVKHSSHATSCILLLCFLKFLCTSHLANPSCSVKIPTNSHDFHRSHNSFQGFPLQKLLWMCFTEEWQELAHYSTQIPVFEWEHRYTATFWERKVKKLQSSSDSINRVEFGNRSNKSCLIMFAPLRWQGEHSVVSNSMTSVLLTQICLQVALCWMYLEESL